MVGLDPTTQTSSLYIQLGSWTRRSNCFAKFVAIRFSTSAKAKFPKQNPREYESLAARECQSQKSPESCFLPFLAVLRVLVCVVVARTVKKVKPALHIDELLLAGFELISKWKFSADGEIFSEELLPKKVGVYAFAKSSTVIYVGVATTTIAKRLRFMQSRGQPREPENQRTSLRLNAIMKSELAAIPSIDIYVAHPVDLDWNGLPIHGSAGLELGLIKKYNLPWNKRSAG